jgi:hypothetical protein
MSEFRITPIHFVFRVLFCMFCFVASSFCTEDAASTTVCQLKHDPRAYNHKLVEVTGFVNHAFENFTIFDPNCESFPEIWLEYGGTFTSGTKYCCGSNPDQRHRGKQLVVEKIPIALNENDQLYAFDKLIQPPFRSGTHGALVHATITARFFAGRKAHHPEAEVLGGYGHMGCCSLLAIEEIKSVSQEYRDDLDYGTSFASPIINPGCHLLSLAPPDRMRESIEIQHQADTGNTDWMFDDPQHVASNALVRLAHIGEHSVSGLTVKEHGQGNIVYELGARARAETYTIVVSRPYWLSFYARDSKRTAWVVIAAYVSSCANTAVNPTY